MFFFKKLLMYIDSFLLINYEYNLFCGDRKCSSDRSLAEPESDSTNPTTLGYR